MRGTAWCLWWGDGPCAGGVPCSGFCGPVRAAWGACALRLCPPPADSTALGLGTGQLRGRGSGRGDGALRWPHVPCRHQEIFWSLRFPVF